MIPLWLVLACAPKSPGARLGRDPSPEAIFDRYLAGLTVDPATAATYTAVQARLEVTVPAAGLRGEGTMWMAAPDQLYLALTLEGAGESVNVYDGVRGWSVDFATGPRVLTGRELAELRYAAHFAGDQDYATRYDRLEQVGEVEFLGQPCWEVYAHTPEDLERSFYFERGGEGRMLGYRSTTHTVLGPIPTVTELHDYQVFGAVRQPARSVMRMMGMEQVMLTEDVVWNPPSGPDLSPPPEVQELLDELAAPAEG